MTEQYFTIAIIGAVGRMGRVISELCPDAGIRVTARVDRRESKSALSDSCAVENRLTHANFDVIVDFSHPDAIEETANFVKKSGKAWLIGTTGLESRAISHIKEAAKFAPVLQTSNTSLGIALMTELTKMASKILRDWDCEIIECHHRNKIDAPSGTALTLLQAASDSREGSEPVFDRHTVKKARGKNEIGIASLRGGSVCGKHSVCFFGDNESIEITHQAESRVLFAKGALTLAAWLKDQKNGLYDASSFVQYYIKDLK